MTNNMASSRLSKMLHLPKSYNCRWHQCYVICGRWGAMQIIWLMVKAGKFANAWNLLGMWLMLSFLVPVCGTYLMLETSLHISVKQNYFQLQTSFHHDRQHGFIRSVKTLKTHVTKLASMWQLPHGPQGQ